VKFRSLAVLGSLMAAGLVATPVAAHAAPTDAVSGLTASVVQTPKSHTTWTITGSWQTVAGAGNYVAYIADDAAGTDSGFSSQDSANGKVSLESDRLAATGTYYLAVRSKLSGAQVATTPFTVPELDQTAPVATYSINRRAGVLIPDYSGMELVRRAPFVLTQTGTDEPITSREVVPGDGSAPVAWPNDRKTVAVTYTKAGVYTPAVRVTDQYGNTADIAQPAVTVTLDTVKPRIAITTPPKAGKVASWRVIRGTASDAGTGVSFAIAFVMQKRGKLWWAYDFTKKKWIKGYSSYKRTSDKSKAEPAFLTVKPNGTWSTPAIKGLKKGSTVVQAVTADLEINISMTQFGPRTLR
jgi:hypothetical protein